MMAPYSPGIIIRSDGNISESGRKCANWTKIAVTSLISCLLLLSLLCHANIIVEAAHADGYSMDRKQTETNAGESQKLDLAGEYLKELKLNCSGINT